MSSTAQRQNGMATAGLALGIVGVLLSFVPVLTLFAVLACALSITFGAIGHQRSHSMGGRGIAIAGWVLGVVGLTLFVLRTVLDAIL